MVIAFNHLGKLGQLGNQMFQYAAAKGISSKLGVDFIIPNHEEIFDDGIGNRYPILLFDAFNLTSLPNRGTFDTENYLQESFFHFDEKFFSLDKKEDCSLWGFFQSEKYFKHVEDGVREDFRFVDRIETECKSFMEGFGNRLALHIRRGDFLINSNNHLPLEMDYYEEALKLFEPDRQVIIFSDDTDWCKEQELFEDERFAISECGDQFYDMCLMSMCDDFIIANSTFSWWGAWLGNRGKVIAPKKWFGENLKDNNLKDLYCDGWILL